MASIQKNVSPLSRALSLMQLEKKDIFTIIMLTFAAGFLALAIPIAVQTLVNIVAMGNVVQPLIVVSFILFLLLLLAGSFAILEYYIVELIQRRIFVSNALLATAHVQAMHLEVREIQNPVELMNRFFDVTTVQKTSYQLLTKGLAAILQAIIGSIVLIFYSIYFAFGVLLLLFITWVIVRVLGRTAVNSAIDESYAKLDVAAWLETIGRNLSMFKFGSSQTYAMQKTDDLTLNYLALRQKHFSTLLKQNLLSAFFYALVGTSMLGLGGWLVMQGVINLGQFVAAELIIFGVLSAFLSFINKLEYFYDLLAGLDKLGSFEDLPKERKGGHSFQVIQAYSVAVSQIIIPNSINQSKINLALAAGKNLAIFTHDESTSAYIAELLVGLREPAAGYIKINDIDIRQLDLSAMRHHVAFIRLSSLNPAPIRPDRLRPGRRRWWLTRAMDLTQALHRLAPVSWRRRFRRQGLSGLARYLA